MSTTEAGRLAASGKPDSIRQAGVSLQAVIEAARRLDELSCARVVGNAADAVHAAQKGGQPLGTLTPASLLVLPDGHVRLVTGAASPRYTAPEKLRGGTGDRRADVFALGVMLWEALAHERLFDGASDDAIKQAVLASAFRPPSELNANVPAELDAICKKALAHDPSDRYQSAKVMAAEIDAVLGDAGYPESNEPIAKYIARALAPEPAIAPKPPVLPVTTPPSKTVAPQGMPGDTLPPPAFMARQPSQAALLGSTNPPVEPKAPGSQQEGSQPLPPILEPPQKPVMLPPSAAVKPATTEILGSLSPLAMAEKPPLAATAFLGSGALNASSAPSAPTTAKPAAAARLPPSSTQPGVPAAPAAPKSSPSVAPVATAASAPAPAMVPPPVAPTGSAPVATLEAAATLTFAPPARTAGPTPAPPVAAAPDAKHALPAPFKPVTQAQPSSKPSIANAETITTPQLPAPLAVPAGPPQLGMPPGMTVAPASPGAPLQTVEQEFEDEHHADPAAVISLPRHERLGTGGRDVLAGWGWTTGSVQAIDDDDDDVHDTARASRKRLMIAIGGALGVVLLIAVGAFAFSGSQKPSDQDEPSTAVKPSTVPTTPPAPPPQPGVAAPTGSADPAPEPPRPEPAAPPTSPEPANVAPPTAPTAEPSKPEPPAAEPPRAAVTEPVRTEPLKPEASKTEPPRAEPPKVAAAVKAPAPPKAEPPKKLDAKKPPEPKKQPDKIVKRPPASDKLAKAPPKGQPVDPYAAPADKPKTDPAAAYKTGLQQYARGDTAGALSTLRTSLSSNPSFAPTWRGLGLVYEKLGNKEQARSAFKRYLQLAPTAGDADQIRDRLERLGS